jgi:hypothetical protein
MQSEDVHNLWQEENTSPLAINYAVIFTLLDTIFKNQLTNTLLEIF